MKSPQNTNYIKVQEWDIFDYGSIAPGFEDRVGEVEVYTACRFHYTGAQVESE